MSEPYQVACIIPDGIDASAGVRKCHQLLKAEGIVLAEDSLLALHDTDDFEPEPREIFDEDSALTELTAWPTMGAIDYAGVEGFVTVEFHRSAISSALVCVIVSAMERAVDRADMLAHYQQLGARLHDGLGARRTIMEWALEMRGFRYVDEVTRLLRGEFVETYPLLDIRNP